MSRGASSPSQVRICVTHATNNLISAKFLGGMLGRRFRFFSVITPVEYRVISYDSDITARINASLK